MAEFLLAFVLVAYNSLANRWRPFAGPAYVPLNLFASAILLVVALGPLELTRADLGLFGPAWGWLEGALAGGALAAPLVVAARSKRWAARIADRRVAGLRGAGLAYQMTIRVPLGTAWLEELAFRGVLYAAWLEHGTVAATIASSVTFGLWHVVPAINMVRANRPGASMATTAATIGGTVVVTALAGAALLWLRLATNGLAAPLALHATLNSVATYAGVSAARKIELGPGHSLGAPRDRPEP